MVSFPNAKINLGLNILSKRADGYHNLESCFYPVEWLDILEIVPSSKIKFSSTGIDIPGNPDENLCLKAYKLLKEKFDLSPIEIHLHKIIPIGAGLGGGSSDAAFTLKNLSQQFDLNLSETEQMDFARQLGSDCAFFIKNKPVMAKDKGDVIEEIAIDLKGKYVTLVYPDIHVSTAEAYGGVTPKVDQPSLTEILSLPISSWKELLKNDFEKSIFQLYPEIKKIKDRLYELGALYASMSGSGSSVYGIFESEINSKKTFPENYKIWSGKLN